MGGGRIATVTVLACDLVASTEQRTSLGDDAADALALVLDHTLRHCVAHHHGNVMKSTGDGLMATFESASDALNAAISAHQRLHRRNLATSADEQLVMRIGVSAGDVQFIAHDCHGTPVVEAARLERAAEPGTIYASALVRSLVGSRGHHDFEPVGQLRLKGLPDPVETFRVPWSPGAEVAVSDRAAAEPPWRIPLPARLTTSPPMGVIGYAAPLAAIDEALTRTSAGEGREIMLVLGEAGQGKTTVAAEAARRAFDRGATVLFGHCEEDLAIPYQLFVEALEHYVRDAPIDRLIAHVDAHGYELTRLVPALSHRIDEVPVTTAADPETERFLVFAAAAGIIAAASEDAPLVLVFDDLQWADKASLLLLAHIAATHPAARLLIIGTIRDSELATALAAREALGSLQRHAHIGRVELHGLASAEVVEYMEAVAGYRLLGDDEVELARAVHRETDGNPFFVGQLLHHLVETGALYKDETGRWLVRGSITLPDSVREVIGGRVVRLGTRAERMLALAAVIGRDFDLDLLAAASTVPADDLLDMLDTAVAAALVREAPDRPGHFLFAHALIQHTLYEDLGPTRREQSHRRIATALEQLPHGDGGARVGELARHWASSTRPGDQQKAIEYARQAGDAALAALAPSEALVFYEEAAALFDRSTSPDPAMSVDLAIGLGTAQRQTGVPAYRDTLLDAARRAIELDDWPRLVAAALATDRGLFSKFGAIDEERVAVFDEALARMDAKDPHRALILATYCLEIVVGSPLEQRQALAAEALAIAEASGDEAVIVRVLNNLAYALMSPPMVEQSLLRTAEGLERAARLGDPVLHFFAANWRRQTCAQAGRVDEMARYTEVMAGLAEQLQQPMLTWVHTFGLAWLAIIRGDPAEAERLANEALEIGTVSGQPDAFYIYGGQLVVVQQQRGTLDLLTPLIEDMAASTPTTTGVLSGALIAADLEAGRLDAARDRMAALAATGFVLEMNPLWISGMAFYAEAAIELDEPAFAAPLFDLLAPWAGQWSDNGATAASPIATFLGGLSTVLGRLDEADAYFARSTSMCRDAGARFFLAHTELLWGRMLMRRGRDGDADRAQALLRDAHETSAAAGYAFVERRAAEALATTTA